MEQVAQLADFDAQHVSLTDVCRVQRRKRAQLRARVLDGALELHLLLQLQLVRFLEQLQLLLELPLTHRG